MSNYKHLSIEQINEWREIFRNEYSRKELYRDAKTLVELAKVEKDHTYKTNMINVYHLAMEVWREKVLQTEPYTLKHEMIKVLLDKQLQ